MDYYDRQRKKSRAKFVGSVLGVGMIVVSIPLGLADIVAPLMIGVFILNTILS